jgi:hypothetical protein
MEKKRGLIIAGSVAAVLIGGVLAGSMAAQAWGPARWAGGGFHRCGFHPGFGDGKGMVDFIIWRMDETVKDLNLTSPQKEEYDKLRAGIKSRAAGAVEGHMVLREDIHKEMAKDVPDVAAVAPKLKNEIGAISAGMQDNIDLFTAFYGSLDNSQKKKVAASIQERMKYRGHN